MRAPIQRGEPVGFIGLGNMGLPMAERLAGAGFVVKGFDVSQPARDHLSACPGAQAVSSLDEAVDGAVAVVLMLPTSGVVEHVLIAEGLLSMIRKDALVIDMGSSEPLGTRSLARQALDQGIELVDAPVSGGVGGAKDGTLSVMFGGDAATLDACRPLFDPLSSAVFRVGDVGAGHAVKALNNLLSATSLLAASEAVAIGRGFGIEPGDMLAAINKSSGRSASTEQKFPKFVLTESYASGFALSLMVKDLRIALGLGDGLGIESPLSAESLRQWDKARSELPDAADHTEIARWVSEHSAQRSPA